MTCQHDATTNDHLAPAYVREPRCPACGAGAEALLRARGIKPWSLPSSVRAAERPELLADLAAALCEFQYWRAMETARRTFDDHEGASAKAIGEALAVLADVRHGEQFRRLAWAVLGSRPAARAFEENVARLAAEAREQLGRKGRASHAGDVGDGGRKRDTLARSFAATVWHVLKHHGVAVSLTREGGLEQTLAALFEVAGEPKADPLRLLSRPRRTTGTPRA